MGGGGGADWPSKVKTSINNNLRLYNDVHETDLII